jgi:predicted GNAT superfamily acetyltransferase
MEKTRFCTMMVRKHHRDCVWYLLANDRVVVEWWVDILKKSFVCPSVHAVNVVASAKVDTLAWQCPKASAIVCTDCLKALESFIALVG